MALDFDGLEAAIAEQDTARPFSGVIFVRESGETRLLRGFGYANKAEEIPNRPDTRFGIASGTKGFTAVAICQLVEQGRLSFDTLLKDCLPVAFSKFDPAITIHHLLTHTSGIPDYFDEEVMDDYEELWREIPMYNIRQPKDFLPLFQDQPMKFKPGEKAAYNNAGFVVLGLVVEQVSGRPYTRYIEENIFKRAGMDDSGFFALDRLPARTAYGYLPAGEEGWRTNFYAVPVVGGPDGGAYTTVLDMAKFWESLLSFKLLNQATTEKMLSPQVKIDWGGPDDHYGYGIYCAYRDGQLINYYLVGQDPGVEFFSTVYPGKQLAYTIMANTNKNTWPFPLVRNAVKSA